MTSRRSNNVLRTEWTRKCREQLSLHICIGCCPLWSKLANLVQDNRLGISIEPSQVRLKTNPDDPYRWETMKEKEHLFLKNLSDLSTGQLKELCDGVDKSFVAACRPLRGELQTESRKESVCTIYHYWSNILADYPFSVHISLSQKLALSERLMSYTRKISD